jgi:hypothetical protein
MLQRRTSKASRGFFSRAVTLAALVVATILAPLHSTLPAQAQEANAANGLQISPAVVEVNGEPGQTYTINVQVTNVTGSDLSFTTDVNDFSAKDESGAPSVVVDDSVPSSASIQSWVTVPSAFDLAARANQTITATLTIPQNAEPGGHYGVIRFSGQTPEVEGSGVGLSASAGSLILVRVAGAVNEELELLTFSASKSGSLGSFFENGPLTFIARFENKGNVHVEPTGQIVVQDMFGNQVGVLKVNENSGNVLPGSIRRFESTLDQQWLFGRFTADIEIGYGTTGDAIVRTITFWVIPWKLIGLCLIGLFTLIFILRTLIKRYNEYIINRSRRHDTKTKTKK